MRIVIISDSHDNLASLKKVAAWVKKEKIKTIIHCGDVCNEDSLKEGLEGFEGKIYLSKGNCDIGDFKNISNLEIWEEFGEINLENRKIAFTHFSDLTKKISEKRKYDIIFYGHTHKPWLQKTDKTVLANPGNLAGIFYKPSFAVYDTKTGKLELKILEKI